VFLEVDEGTFVKEVADICQGGLLERKSVQTNSNLSTETNDLPRARKDTRI
jgi:hypothetical protein